MTASAAHAADQGTAAEGFTNGKGFKDRDLYIRSLDFTGKTLAHGERPLEDGGHALLGRQRFNLTFRSPRGQG